MRSNTGDSSVIRFDSRADLSNPDSEYHSTYGAAIAAYVNDSWKFIQAMHEGWLWRRKEFSAVLAAGTPEYRWDALVNSESERSITRFRDWHFSEDDPWYVIDAQGVAWPLVARDPERSRRDRITARNVANARPGWFAPSLDGKSFRLFPTPDIAYTLEGMHQTGIQELDKATDVPEIPNEAYHDAIAWRAVMLAAEHDGFHETRANAQMQYDELMRSMARIYLADTEVPRGEI